MALTDWAAYEAALATSQRVGVLKTYGATATFQMSSFWLTNPAAFAGVAPTTPVAPTRATLGAINPDEWRNGDTALRVSAIELGNGLSSTPANTLILADRLSHQGGLDGTVTTANVTTNLPTAALTRYTDGAGVMAAIEIYATLGATATTITCEYTNQAGTGGRVSQPVVIGGTGRTAAGTIIPLSLQAGDTGVRSIENSTLLASTLTAGAFGYTLFKPLVMVPISNGLTTDWNAMLGGGGNLAEVVDNACLAWFWRWAGSAIGGHIEGELRMIET